MLPSSQKLSIKLDSSDFYCEQSSFYPSLHPGNNLVRKSCRDTDRTRPLACSLGDCFAAEGTPELQVGPGRSRERRPRLRISTAWPAKDERFMRFPVFFCGRFFPYAKLFAQLAFKLLLQTSCMRFAASNWTLQNDIELAYCSPVTLHI